MPITDKFTVVDENGKVVQNVDLPARESHELPDGRFVDSALFALTMHQLNNSYRGLPESHFHDIPQSAAQQAEQSAGEAEARRASPAQVESKPAAQPTARLAPYQMGRPGRPRYSAGRR
jgi:hypothetical protein